MRLCCSPVQLKTSSGTGSSNKMQLPVQRFLFVFGKDRKSIFGAQMQY